MNAKKIAILGLTIAAIAVAFFLRSQKSNDGETISVEKGTPTMIELGSDSCASCKAMQPVLTTLREKHGKALQVHFIDVWKQPEQGEKYGVKTIPTQVLLDENGKEITRHTGYWSPEAIEKAFADASVTL